VLQTINVTESLLEAVPPYCLPAKSWCFALNQEPKNNKELKDLQHPMCMWQGLYWAKRAIHPTPYQRAQ